MYSFQRITHPPDRVVTVMVRTPLHTHGFVLALAALDRLLGEVLGVLDGADLNQVVPEMGSGHLQTFTEAPASWAWERLAEQIPEPAYLIRM